METVYVHEASLYCQKCAESIRGAVSATLEEADTPQHCAGCDVFFENDLTQDGVDYVLQAFIDFAEEGIGSPEVIQEWAEKYVKDYFEGPIISTREFNACDKALNALATI